jgi:hypothetical protein
MWSGATAYREGGPHVQFPKLFRLTLLAGRSVCRRRRQIQADNATAGSIWATCNDGLLFWATRAKQTISPCLVAQVEFYLRVWGGSGACRFRLRFASSRGLHWPFGCDCLQTMLARDFSVAKSKEVSSRMDNYCFCVGDTVRIRETAHFAENLQRLQLQGREGTVVERSKQPCARYGVSVRPYMLYFPDLNRHAAWFGDMDVEEPVEEPPRKKSCSGWTASRTSRHAAATAGARQPGGGGGSGYLSGGGGAGGGAALVRRWRHLAQDGSAPYQSQSNLRRPVRNRPRG